MKFTKMQGCGNDYIYVNCFPDPRYEGIPENASITVAGQPWDPGAHGGAQYPFTINYYEQDGAQIKDDHAPGTYIAKVEILPGLSVRPADILINGQRMYFGTGTLSIRAASNATEIENIEEISSQVTTDEPSQSVDQAVAVMPDNVNYLVNGITGQVPNPGADIRLLQDEVLSAGGDDEDQYVRMMRERLEVVQPGLAVKPGETPRQYAMKYLDLIDAHDSNLIVTPNLKYGQSYDLYIPYPTGTDENYEFQMFCFDDLDRTYTEKDYGANVENVIESSKVSELEVTPTEFGLKVTIGHNGRLGAMALTWQQSEHTITATAGTGGSISPSGAVGVRHTGEETFTITPDKGYAVANVKIDGRSIGAVKSYTFENVKRAHTIETSFTRANEFIDVPTSSYFYEAVMWAVENGVTTGISASRFDPDGICTRAQAVAFLWRAAGSPAPRSRAMPFTDVPAGSYYYYAVLWAVENGITEGTSDTRFSPNATCTRAQIVAFLWRSEKSPAASSRNPFADVKSSAYYADAVLWAVKEDITRGTTNTTFSPDADCTRAQIVTFLWRCKK